MVTYTEFASGTHVGDGCTRADLHNPADGGGVPPTLGDLPPEEIVNRPKMGFTLPYEQWMRQELRGFCESRLRGIAARVAFDTDTILKSWEDFLVGSPTISWSRLWKLVAFEHRLERNRVE